MSTRQPIDWNYVRAIYESGSTAYQIAKRPDMPSKQAIQNRANRDKWQRAETVKRLPIVAKALSINSSLLTDDLLAVVLDLIANGATQEIAAQAAGISGRTWSSWCKQDQSLRDAVRRARAGKVAQWMQSVDTASQTDWRAGQWLLQTASETREAFNKSAETNTLQVVFNIDRNATSGPVIDVTPEADTP